MPENTHDVTLSAGLSFVFSAEFEAKIGDWPWYSVHDCFLKLILYS